MENNSKSILESLIFVSGKPIKLKKLASISQLEEADVKLQLEELNNDYVNQGGGVQLLLKDDSVQMVSNPKYGEYVKKMVTEELQEDLSKVALETLAIIAYRGPIDRVSIENIRGVNCVYILRNLLIRGLIEKAKSNTDARKSVYQVSFNFMKHLGIKSVNDLPQFEKLSREKLIESENKDTENTELENENKDSANSASPTNSVEGEEKE
jgi:segregation and condensation protein B